MAPDWTADASTEPSAPVVPERKPASASRPALQSKTRDDKSRPFHITRRGGSVRRARSVSLKLDEPLPFDFVANPGANYGLINAVNSLTERPTEMLYIGSLGIEMNPVAPELRDQIDFAARVRHGCVPVWLRDEFFVQSYHHYCKQVLWPTFHFTLPSGHGLKNEHNAFQAYVEVNRRFAERIVQEYREGDLVWVQDYHLLLVPQMVREQLPRAAIGLFVHIAFPSSEIFRCLSRREELLLGMLGADLIGFQTHNFCRHFRQTVSRILQLDTTAHGVQLMHSFVNVVPFPIGIDVAALNRRREAPEVLEWVRRLEERYAGRYVIVGRDKLDWIKGVREKMLGFEVFLDEHPEWAGRVVLVQVALATVQEDREFGDVTDIVARINRKHSSLMYQPVVFLHVQEITFSQYLALLTVADAFVATSLREGMNLTSHEYVIAQEKRKRPLILSEFTGTYSALRACIGVNPWNARQVAHAFQSALTMQEDEMAQRWRDLHHTVVTQTAQHWVTSVLSQLERAHEAQPHFDTLFTPRLEIAQLASEWRAAKSRLILLDLEQTLVCETAEHAHERGFVAPNGLVRVLRHLVSDTRNYVYLLSGKGIAELNPLAARVPAVGLVGENGCFVRLHDAPGATWQSLVDGFNLDWKVPVREILHYFTERTPGAWIEERRASIAWYFGEWSGASAADAQWARRQASEVQSLIYDSLGERYALRILNHHTHFYIMPKNVSRTSAVQYLFSLDAMGSLPRRTVHDRLNGARHDKDMFEFVLQIGRDEALIAYLNQLDLPFAPRTCTTAEMHTGGGSSAACQLAPGQDVLNSLEEMVDFHLRDLKWGGPAMVDV